MPTQTPTQASSSGSINSPASTQTDYFKAMSDGAPLMSVTQSSGVTARLTEDASRVAGKVKLINDFVRDAQSPK